MLNLKTLALGTLLAAASLGASANPMQYDARGYDHRATDTRHIDARQAEQAARIDHALREGRLSRREFRSLQREQAEIRRFEATAKADGIVTRSERRELQDMLDRASWHISRA